MDYCNKIYFKDKELVDLCKLHLNFKCGCEFYCSLKCADKFLSEAELKIDTRSARTPYNCSTAFLLYCCDFAKLNIFALNACYLAFEHFEHFCSFLQPTPNRFVAVIQSICSYCDISTFSSLLAMLKCKKPVISIRSMRVDCEKMHKIRIRFAQVYVTSAFANRQVEFFCIKCFLPVCDIFNALNF